MKHRVTIYYPDSDGYEEEMHCDFHHVLSASRSYALWQEQIGKLDSLVTAVRMETIND